MILPSLKVGRAVAGFVFLVLLLPACSSTAQRAGIVTAGAAAAGIAGYHASGKKSEVGAAAAALGAGATLLALGPDRAVRQEGLDRGYELGTGDAIKRHYWLRQALQREQAQTQATGARQYYYTMEFAETQTTPDGRKLVPHSVTVPVIEPR